MENEFYFSDQDNSISYGFLFNEMGQGNVHTSKAFKNTADFLVNFLKALAHNVDITLVDPLNPADGNDAIIAVSSIEIDSFEQFNHLIKNSNSQVSLFTSGTTGQPKKITHTVKNLIREVRVGAKYESNVWGFAYNPTHMAGLQVLFQAMLNKNTLVDIFSKGKNEIIELVDQKKISNISATPTFYRFLLPIKNELLSVKNVSLGGEKSDEKLIESIQKAFPKARVFNIYASTEAGTIFSSHGAYFQLKENTKDFVKVVDNELFIHNNLLGKNDNLNLEWYPTGDLIEWVDQENKIFKFRSRKNEMINVGGNKVNPHHIEEILTGIKGVESCLVYGMPNTLLGNLIAADIVLQDQSITDIDLKKHLRSVLEPFEIPRKINFVESLEITRTGKLKRNK